MKGSIVSFRCALPSRTRAVPYLAATQKFRVNRIPVVPSTPAALCTVRRNIWNPFASFAAKAEQSVAEENSNASSVANPFSNKQVDQQLSSLSERLVSSCLAILDICGTVGGSVGGAGASSTADLNSGNGPIDRSSRDVLYTVVDTFMHQTNRRPGEQFDVVYTALCLPVVAQRPQLRRHLLVVLESITPSQLFHFFENSGILYMREMDEDRRECLLLFIHALLGDVRVPRGSDLLPEELLSVYAEDFARAFPDVADTDVFKAMDLRRMMLQGQLFTLMGQLCVDMDPERTGKVKLDDLRAMAKRVLGEEQAGQLLDGAVADKDGRIAYAQLTAILTRPPPQKTGAEKV